VAGRRGRGTSWGGGQSRGARQRWEKRSWWAAEGEERGVGVEAMCGLGVEAMSTRVVECLQSCRKSNSNKSPTFD
jgi:hypothetical protein